MRFRMCYWKRKKTDRRNRASKISEYVILKLFRTAVIFTLPSYWAKTASYTVSYMCVFFLFVSESNLPLVSSQLETSFNIFLHGLINYIAIEAKCRHLKKLTCKGTLWQVFIRVHRLEIQFSHVGIFDPAMWREGQFRGQKNRAPLKISLEMVHEVFCHKNNLPHFQNERYINS